MQRNDSKAFSTDSRRVRCPISHVVNGRVEALRQINCELEWSRYLPMSLGAVSHIAKHKSKQDFAGAQVFVGHSGPFVRHIFEIFTIKGHSSWYPTSPRKWRDWPRAIRLGTAPWQCWDDLREQMLHPMLFGNTWTVGIFPTCTLKLTALYLQKSHIGCFWCVGTKQIVRMRFADAF